MIVPAETLAGRREMALLDLPSVRRMADALAAHCHEPSWVRTSVASLDRFRAVVEARDLEALIERARGNVAVAEQALVDFAHALRPFTDTQVAALALGPKLWFRLNGIPVAWRVLPAVRSTPSITTSARHVLDRMVLLALIGSGLHLAELLRLRIGDVGSLDVDGQILPDIDAEPLAVRYIARRGRAREYITFLSFQARAALQAHWEQRAAAGQPLDHNAPLIARRDGAAATASSVAYARRRNQALIRAGNHVNVTMCRATGDFFREWGMPGARFTARQHETEP